MELIPIFALGFLASYFGSLLGLGGGFILVPALHLLIGLSMRDAIFFSLVSILCISLIHNTRNRSLIRSNRQLLIPMAIFAVLGSLGGAYSQVFLKTQVLELSFGLLLVLVAVYLLSKPEPKISPKEKPLLLANFVQVVAGFLSGLFGIGGGILTVPALNRLIGYPLQESARISFFFIFVSSSVALAVLVRARREELELIPPLLLAALVIGSLTGAGFAMRSKISSEFLRKLFSITLLGVGLLQIWKTL